MTPARALSGRTVVVTRPRAQAGPLARALRRLGARVVLAPVLRFRSAGRRALAAAARRAAAGGYDWIFFTSANGVAAWRPHWRKVARRRGAPCRVAAIGRATATALARMGWRAALVPSPYTTAALLSAWKRVARSRAARHGSRVLLLQADIAPPHLARGIAACGASVTRVDAYRTVGARRLPRRAAAQLAAGAVDWIVFTSASTAAHAAAALRAVGVKPRRVAAVSIGPVTTRAARRAGFRVAAEARLQTVAGLVAALATAAEKRKEPPAGGSFGRLRSGSGS